MSKAFSFDTAIPPIYWCIYGSSSFGPPVLLLPSHRAEYAGKCVGNACLLRFFLFSHFLIWHFLFSSVIASRAFPMSPVKVSKVSSQHFGVLNLNSRKSQEQGILIYFYVVLPTTLRHSRPGGWWQQGREISCIRTMKCRYLFEI